MEPTQTVAWVALGFAGLVTALVVVGAMLSWSAAPVLRAGYLRGESGLDGPLTAHDLVSIPLILAVVGSWIATSVWLSRAYRNAELTGSWRPARSRVWCWLGWIVPIVSLWFPFQVVRDVHRASTPEHRPPPALGLWWALWLASLTLGNLADRLSLGSAGLAGFELLGPVETVNAGLTIGALVLWVRIVRSTVTAQERVAGGR